MRVFYGKMILDMKKVYLDACCLNRPFDDQEQARIHLESEAVRFILRHIGAGDFVWVGSDVLEYEIHQAPDINRRAEMLFSMEIISETVESVREDIESSNRKPGSLASGGIRMINTQGMSPEKIRLLGLEVLNRELGPDVMIEFLQQFSTGSGDYTKERASLFKGETGESILNKTISFR
jgi:hypothetical protein